MVKCASVTNMLKYLGWPTLEQRRKIPMLFKIMNHFMESPSGKLLISNCVYVSGHNKKFWQLLIRLESFQSFFLMFTQSLSKGLY